MSRELDLQGMYECSKSQDYFQVREVCALVAIRGARLTGAATAGIMRHLGCDDKAHLAKRNVVAVEGAVMRDYHLYRWDCSAAALALTSGIIQGVTRILQRIGSALLRIR